MSGNRDKPIIQNIDLRKNMQATYGWGGITITGFKDSKNNQYEVSSGTIRLASGQVVSVPEADRPLLVKAALEHMMKAQMGGSKPAGAGIAFYTNPDDILSIAAAAIQSGNDKWKHVLHELSIGNNVQWDGKTLCVSPTVLGTEVSPAERLNAYTGGPTRFICTGAPADEMADLASPPKIIASTQTGKPTKTV